MSGVGRSSFSMVDDKKMLKFLIEQLREKNPLAKNPKGLEIWKMAEERKITNKSYQSMSTRMRRNILSSLDIQPISKEDIHFLKRTFFPETVKESKSAATKDDKKDEEDFNESDESSTDASDDDDSALSDYAEASSTAKSDSKSKRMQYTNEDDVKMLTFLKQEIKAHNIKSDYAFSTKFWHDAFLQKITKHSDQSMQGRFARVLFPKLDTLEYVPEDLKYFLHQRLVPKNNASIGDRMGTRNSPAKASTTVQVTNSPKKAAASGSPKKSTSSKKKIIFFNDDEKQTSSDDEVEVPRKRVLRGVGRASPIKTTSDSEPAGTSHRHSSKEANASDDDEKEEEDQEELSTDDDGQPDEDDLMKIIKNGGDLSNDLRFKSVVFDHIYRGTFETRDEVKIFTDKFRLVEAMSEAYAIPMADILPLIKTCDNDLRQVEKLLYDKRAEKVES